MPSFFVLFKKARMYYIRRNIVTLNWSIQSRQLDIKLEKICNRNVMVAHHSVCTLLSMRKVSNALSPMKEHYEININTDVYILFSYYKNVKSSSNNI